ncbi:MAG: hypothetical protein F4X34_00265 [Chloroflexi bacterium]|nr:hypothetical protein [Chloroflexota bacterium]
MSGRHKWSELTNDFSPERKQRIKMEAAKLGAKIDREIHIEPIVLDWSEWHCWDDVKRLVKDGGVNVPDDTGVYEVKLDCERKRLTIGKTGSSLRMRVKQALVKENGVHSTGQRIRADIKNGKLPASDIRIRWAVTERPAAVEEELHIRYQGKFGELPKYTRST